MASGSRARATSTSRSLRDKAPEKEAWRALGEAHVYQVTSAKDELPRQYFVTADLLGRCPNLLCASSNGAGYDTVDVSACTAAGVLVVNQTGGNARSVAEHALGLMLSVSIASPNATAACGARSVSRAKI